MQTSVPELTDLSKEPAQHASSCTAPDARKPGTFAANCLLARRLAERGVRFIQLYHRDWDHHGEPARRTCPKRCQETDQPSAALILDLEQRGMLDDTLVVWGGEFGRTVYCQGRLTATDYGRDHHPRCFTMWMAGGGIKPGITLGETDDYCYNITEDPVHVHDLQATILHCLGIDHTRLTYKFQGRQFRLTDVAGNVVKPRVAGVALRSGFLEALGGEAGCKRLSEEFYARVGKDPVLRPLFPGKSLRCAIQEFAAFLIQFLGGDEEQTQHRWWLSLRESHARFRIGPAERSAWLKHMGATLEAAPLDEGTRKALRQFFLHSSAYVIGKEAAGPEHEELAARWGGQRVLDDVIGAIAAGHDPDALALAPQVCLPSVGVRWTAGADDAIGPRRVDSLRDRCRAE